jgi:two-component system CAI-1 autoinducer sensor kinase/phosphatase CqsS
MFRISSLIAAAKRSAEYSEKHFVPIGVICLVVMPLTTYIERIVAAPTFDTLWIRSSASVFGIGLVVYPRLSYRLKTNFYVFWLMATTYVLPFCFGLMLILNASHAPIGQEASPIWVYQYLVALVFFVNLIHHGPLSTVLWVVASSLCLSVLFFIDSVNWAAVESVVLLPLPVYVTAVVIGSLMNRNVAMPLASIGTTAKGVTNLLPVLTSAYDRAKEAGIQVEPLRRTQLEKLNEALESIGKEVEYSNTIIDMLLVNTTDKPLSDVDAERFSVESVIREAVRRYPFNNSRERNMITVRVEDDFDARAPRLLIVHVLFNLIKNGLYFVQKAGKGGIVISTRLSAEGNQIVVHDNGAGIPPGIRPHIFERFYTTTQAGQSAGIGLSFCRLVMDSVGGGISCESEVGEFATFYLTFPPVKD